jgi:DNA-binding NtrC family response regulator
MRLLRRVDDETICSVPPPWTDVVAPDSEVVIDQPDPGVCPEELSESERIRAKLQAVGGNVARAARRLGIARGTPRYRILKYGFEETISRD